MTDRETVYRGLSHAAWGYFFLNFDLNVGTVSVLPRFVGWLLFLSAIGKLSPERRDLSLLRPLAVLLACWNGLDWLLSWRGGDLDGQVLFLDLLAAAAGLYFHFQFLTDLAALASLLQPEGAELDRRLLRRRTGYVLLVTSVSLLTSLTSLGGGAQGWPRYLALALTVLACVEAARLMASLFALRRCGA